MTYFKQRRSQRPHEPAFPQIPAESLDGDDDRIYTEEDYAAPDLSALSLTEEDAFLPDEDDGFYPEDYADEPDDYYPDEDDLDPDGPLDDDLLTDEERAALRRSHWQLLSGLADFVGVIVGTGVILLLVMLLISLLNWLHADINQTFTLWQIKL